MIARIITFSARNRGLVLLATLVAVGAAVWAIRRVPLDAVPDLSDTQVIVFSQWDRSPDLIEDQVTYPIVTALLGTPHVKAVRAFSDFGYSYVYVIFADGTDLYWARSRVLEYLSKIQPRLPEGVRTEIGPDATSVGWVFQYALVDRTGRHDLAALRSLQDWSLRYQLQAVPGVAEVAAVGGFVKQYQVTADPARLLANDVTLPALVDAVRKGNVETGGRLLELAGTELMVRGRGYVRSPADLEELVVRADGRTGTPVLVKHVATVSVGSELRRGVADLDGLGDTVGGIVVMRQGENALTVIDRVKAKLDELRPTLPEGVEVLTTYDRSDLIRRAIDTLVDTLAEELVIVSLVILLFLWHVPSAIVPIVTIPVSVLLAFVPFYFLGLTANIMSLAGIAISIGVLVDGAIVEVENAYKRIEQWIAGGRKGDVHAVRLRALTEVGPSVFFSLLLIAVSFLPVFTLVDQEGRLFKPLAYSKNLTMAIAAVLAITLDPALRMFFTRVDPIVLRPAWLGRAATALLVGRYVPEERHPVSRLLIRAYEPACRWVLRHRRTTVALALLAMASTVWPFLRLGSEFMPTLHEGAFLYMPTALPGMSVTEAQRVLQIQDRILKGFPEVERVFGKAGRATSPTDPAPLSMVETTVVLKPEAAWRPGLTFDALQAEMDAALRLPGMPNVWTMPIRNRIDMLSTGMRTPIGVKVLGPDLTVIQDIGTRIEALLQHVPGTRHVVAERTAGGYYLDFELDRAALARHGVTVEDAQAIVQTAVGGETITTTVEGRERYGVAVRYARDFRDDPDALARVLVPTPGGAQVPIGQLARLRIVEGPAMIRNESGQLAGYVFVDMTGRDMGGYVAEAKAVLARALALPTGYTLVWSGQYENLARVRERMTVVLPLTLALIVLLLYLNTRSAAKTTIVLTAVPFSVIGAVWLLWALDYDLSIAVWVGMIALMGLDAETGVFMLLYLDLAWEERRRAGALRTRADIEDAIVHGAVRRVRPKLMTVLAAFMGLLPIMWSTGAGADVMKRIAAPMVGGLVTSFALELLVYPALYAMWRSRELARPAASEPASPR